jgi:hypothetical protein
MHNDQLVYLYGASFGSSGPDSSRPAFDPVMSAMAGGEVLQAGRGNPPQMRQTTDHGALLGVAVAILLALRERDRRCSSRIHHWFLLGSRRRRSNAPPAAVTGGMGIGLLWTRSRASSIVWSPFALRLAEVICHSRSRSGCRPTSRPMMSSGSPRWGSTGLSSKWVRSRRLEAETTSSSSNVSRNGLSVSGNRVGPDAGEAMRSRYGSRV